MTFRCRSCDAATIAPVLDLGAMPLANALRKTADTPEPKFPLALVVCTSCSLVQITESVPPQQLFGEYLYFSSFSDTMLRHAKSLATRLINERRLKPESLVVEAASNDGYLLEAYRAANLRVLGIEPAANIAAVANERGITTRCEFFGAALGAKLASENLRADVFHANNVLAHVPDLNGFVQGIAATLRDDGVAVIEVPYVRDMIDHCEFDTIYHEHLSYFSLTALVALFARHDLAVGHVERLPIHGGSLRLFVSVGDSQTQQVLELLKEEAAWGVRDAATYQPFATRVATLKSSLCKLLAELKASGQRIAAYGASAKGATLLNYFGIGKETIDFVVDRSTVKQGYLTPGTHVPIFAPEKLLQDMPSHVLLLTWNFADEILAQQTEYRRRGGKFIIPIPSLQVV